MFIWKIIKSVLYPGWALFSAFIIMLSGVINGGEITCSPNAELVKTDKFTLDRALLMSQGITTDGEYFYTAGSISALDLVGMAKWTVDGFERVAYTHFAIPKEIKEKYNSDHIGGISYYDGKIYAATEDETDTYNLILIYDAETLEFTGEYYDLGTEYLDDGIPYCQLTLITVIFTLHLSTKQTAYLHITLKICHSLIKLSSLSLLTEFRVQSIMTDFCICLTMFQAPQPKSYRLLMSRRVKSKICLKEQ